MAGKRPADAVNNFIDPIRQALACFAHGSLTVDTWHPSENPGILTFNRNEDFPVGSNGAVRLAIQMQYEIVEAEGDRGPWKVSTIGYIYDLRVADGRMREYHWHPISDSHVKEPHAHIDGAKAHERTGRILIEGVLAQTMEFGADCLDRKRWDSLKPRNEANFAKGATWGTPPPHPDLA